MGRIKNWFIKHKPSKRRLIQLYCALLVNSNIKGFFTGTISESPTKGLCAPGMNCYSCPGAIASCPIGALQNSYARSNKSFLFYILGIIGLFGVMLGRLLCGFLCPFGFIQDLLYMIKTPKIKKSKATRILSYLKYILLFLLVVAAPIAIAIINNETIPAFCKMICPVGTIGGSIYIVFNPNNADIVGGLTETFTVKLVVAILIMGLCIFIARPFCRFICPMGAILSFFNGFSIFGIKVDNSKCVSCGKCVTTCKYDIKHPGDRECISCGECIKECPTKAIYYKQIKDFIHVSKHEEPIKEAVSNQINNNDEQIIETEVNGSNTAQNGAEVAVSKKPNKKKVLTTVTVSAMLTVLTGSLVYFNFFAESSTKGKIISIGEEINERSLYSFDNPSKAFNTLDYKGSFMVINFWSTTCSGCIAELPDFELVQKEYPSVKFVAVDVGDDKSVANEFIVSHEWDEWNIEFVFDNIDAPLLRDFTYGSTIPVTALVNQDFKLFKVLNGSVTKENLEKDLIEMGVTPN